MNIIRSWEDMARALDSPNDPDLKQCLQAHHNRLAEWHDFDLTDLAIFIIVQPDDTLLAVEDALDRTLVRDSRFALLPEYVDQLAGWFEACFVLSDDGFGLVLLMQDRPETDQCLLAACRQALSHTDNVSVR